MSLHLILNRLISFLDFPLEAQDVLLQGLNDPLQLHLLPLQALNVIGSLFDLLLQAAELWTQETPPKSLHCPLCLPNACMLTELPIATL